MNEEDARRSIHAVFSRSHRPPAPGFEARMQAALQSTPAPARPMRRSSDYGPARRFRTSSHQWVGGLAAMLLAIAVVAGLLYARYGLGPQGSSMASPVPGFQAVDGVSMVSSTVGWRSDDGDGHMLRTTDGGVHWADVTPFGPTPLNDYYLDATHAWIVASQSILAPGSTYPFGPVQLLTLRTADGGRTWQQGATVTGFASGWTQLLKYGPVADINLFFIDYIHGWLLVPTERSKTLYRTTDGGLHWKVVARDSVEQSRCRWSRLAFASLRTGWITNSCVDLTVSESTPLLVTHDGGLTWQPQRLPVAATNVCHGPSSRCFLDCPPTFGLRASWIPFSNWAGCFGPPLFFDDTHGVLLVWSPNGSQYAQSLLVTADGGNSWSVRPLPGEIQLQVEFVDADHGWAIAGPIDQFRIVQDSTLGQTYFEGPPPGLPLYRTVDGGATWLPIETGLLLQSPEHGQFMRLHFVDQSHGFAYYSKDGTVVKTADGGQSWSVAS
jgi:photosystem II stability/assembly factor-like uncharacterized protein